MKPAFVLLFLSAASTGMAQTVPFRVTPYNNISIGATLNQRDTLHLMFHTAANSLMLTEAATKRLKTLVFSRTDSVSSWGGGGNASRFSPTNTLQLGEMLFRNVPLWEDKNSGQETDGKFGPDLFTGKAITIDFDKQLLSVGDGLPPDIASYEKLKLTNEGGLLFVEARCTVNGRVLTNSFLLHSGYSGDVLLDDNFVTANGLAGSLEVIGEKILKDSFGNEIKTQKAVLPVFSIGKQALKNVPAGFFPGALGRQKMSIIGGDVLKRFNIVIDAKREFLYLRANSLANVPYSTI